MHPKPPTRTRRAVLRASAVAVAIAVTASGCASDTVQRGYLPGYTDGEVTNHTASMTDLWVGSWVAALAVGVLTWGLILWCVAAYRKRRDDHRLPVQTRYHLPLELMYTFVPLVMVLVLFLRTDTVMSDVQDTAGAEEADVQIQVVGKQWSWDFNYLSDDVYDFGVHEANVGELTAEDEVDGAPGTSTSFPTLYLPVNQSVHFTLDSRDVIHSFWIPAFLYKQDMIPDRTNEFVVTPTREGTYAGKCAELCGEFHSGMLFNVKVVSEAEYQEHMDELRDKGQTGALESGEGSEKSGLDRSDQSSTENEEAGS